MQTLLELNDDLLNQAKLFAQQKHTTLSNLVEDALTRYMQKLPVFQGEAGVTASVNNSLTNRALVDFGAEASVFPATQLESLYAPSKYHGKSLSLEDI